MQQWISRYPQIKLLNLKFCVTEIFGTINLFLVKQFCLHRPILTEFCTMILLNIQILILLIFCAREKKNNVSFIQN